MPTIESQALNRLTVADLAPLRRMLGPHSLVIRVNADDTLAPFELMPELFLGRPIRRLLDPEVRGRFEAACAEAVAASDARVFHPDPGATDEVMITPVFDGDQPRFLVAWARAVDNHGRDVAECDAASLRWSDLALVDVEVRYRASGPGEVECAPWWATGSCGIGLWEHPEQVAAVAMAAPVMSELIAESLAAVAAHDGINLRIQVPGPEMVTGMLQVFHGSLRATGVDPDRIIVGVPVELAVDPDLLPLVVHLRTFGLRIDIVGLDVLTAKLHRVSDTTSLNPKMPPIEPVVVGDWTTDLAQAIADARSFE